MERVRMELRQLEYFQMAARLKNITRAAERLRVSQPNITVAIKKLESELGIQLFDRSQKQLSLTPEGSVFLTRVELALRNIQDAVLEVNDYKQLQKGTIKIGIPPMIGAYLFPMIFANFQKRYSHLNIYLYEEGSMDIRDHLEQDEIDFGIVIMSDMTTSLMRLPIAHSRIVACMPEDHPLAQRTSLGYEDLQDMDLIMLKEGSFLRHLLLESFRTENISPNIVLESNQIETIKGLVRSGVGIACLLDLVVHDSPGLKTVPLNVPPYLEIGLAWKKDRYISKAAQAFIDFCRDTLVKPQAFSIKDN